MKYAILSDIHSNLEALECVLDDARKQECSDFVCLGDVVGYGPNPKQCLDIIRNLNCATVMGNHDEYCASTQPMEGFNPVASDAIKWTREQLPNEDKLWLQHLKYVSVVDAFTIVHATLDLPDKWAYVFDKFEAAASFNYQRTAVCFHGHTHVPVAFIRSGKGTQVSQYKKINIELGQKYFINVGSVGQPRDRDPRASYVVFDISNHVIELRRLEYDIPSTQAKIRDAGLPESLAVRIESGR